MGSNKIPETSSKFTYDTSYKKPDVPKPKEKPIMGLSSRKNFIISNAVENILAPPKVMKQETIWTTKKDYGKTPDYL